jgi:hypothetical protein
MSQSFSQLISGSTTFSELYGRINNNIEAVRSQWSGTTAPADPVQGQPFLNTNTGRLYIWSGSAWLDATGYLPEFTAIASEVTAARGSAASLDARLDVSINEDGTLKGGAPAGNWWMTEADTVAYDTASTFTVSGDKTAVYTANRAVKLTQSSNDAGHVVSASYSSGPGETTVTVDCTVDAGLSAVEYGQPVDNEPKITELTGTALNEPELKDYAETRTTPSSSSGTLTLDINNGNVFEVTLTEDVTTLTVSNPSASGKACSFTLILTQDSTARTITWPGSVKWPGGEEPDLSTVDTVYVLTFLTTNAGATWYGFPAGSEMS